MKATAYIAFTCCLATALGACNAGNTFSDPEAFLEAYKGVADAHAEDCSHGHCAEMMYLSPDYVIVKEVQRGIHRPADTVALRKERLAERHHFMLSVTDEFKKNLKQATAGAADGLASARAWCRPDQFVLLQNEGEVPCAMVQVEDMQGLGPSKAHILFNSAPSNDPLSVVWSTDLGVFRFKFSNLLTSLPKENLKHQEL